MSDAAEQLAAAFAGRAEGCAAAVPRVGVFGVGLPGALIRAAGAEPVDITAAPDGVAEVPAVTALTEPFLDPATIAVLHRLAAGAFDGYAALVFCGADPAGQAAYQYALEMRRLGDLPKGPPLHLWNLVHSASAAAEAFNLTEAARLNDLLTDRLGQGIPDDLSAAQAEEESRRAALTTLAEADLSPGAAFAWRNAGRWLPPARHADLLTEALKTAPTVSGPGIGHIGSATLSLPFYDMLGRIGPVAADLQPYGDGWPLATRGGDLRSILRAAATDPAHPRCNPPGCHRDYLLQRLSACDVVVAQVSAQDQSVGWLIPALAEDLGARGIPFVSLGFLPDTPDDTWLTEAEAAIRAALETRP